MSDLSFLAAQYGRGCNRCDDHPLVRKPRWEFHGLRLCTTCFNRETVRDYQLSLPAACYVHLPNIQTFRCYFGRHVNYKTYLRADITGRARSNAETHEAFLFQWQLSEFIEAVQTQAANIEDAKADENEAKLNARQDAIDACLAIHFPSISPDDYEDFRTYRAAIKRTTPFTKTAEKGFIRRLRDELESLGLEVENYGGGV